MASVRLPLSPSTAGPPSYAASEVTQASPATYVAIAEPARPVTYTTATSVARPLQATWQRACTVAAPAPANLMLESLVAEPDIVPTASQLTMAIARASADCSSHHIQAALRDAERACMRSQTLRSMAVDTAIEATSAQSACWRSRQHVRPLMSWPSPPQALLMQPPIPPQSSLDGRITALEAKKRMEIEMRSEMRTTEEEWRRRENELMEKVQDAEQQLERRAQDGGQEVEQLRFELKQAVLARDTHLEELKSVRKELVEYEEQVRQKTEQITQMELRVSSERDATTSSLQRELQSAKEDSAALRRALSEHEHSEGDLRRSFEETRAHRDLVEKELITIKEQLWQKTEQLTIMERRITGERDTSLASLQRELQAAKDDNAILQRVVSEHERSEADLRRSIEEEKSRGDLLEKELLTVKAERDLVQKQVSFQDDVRQSKRLTTQIGELTNNMERSRTTTSPRDTAAQGFLNGSKVLVNLEENDKIAIDLSEEMDYR